MWIVLARESCRPVPRMVDPLRLQAHQIASGLGLHLFPPAAAPTQLSTTIVCCTLIMDKVNQLLGKLPAMPHCGLVLLATIGGLFVASKLFSYLRLVLGSFILPGTNVRRVPRLLPLPR